MIIVRRFSDPSELEFADASRMSTDEHNNLEIWGGNDGETLLYVCAESHWHEVAIDNGEH